MEACPASVLESLAPFCVACCPLPADLVLLGGVAGSCCMSGMAQDWRLPLSKSSAHAEGASCSAWVSGCWSDPERLKAQQHPFPKCSSDTQVNACTGTALFA